jgi:hypothetical protein
MDISVYCLLNTHYENGIIVYFESHGKKNLTVFDLHQIRHLSTIEELLGRKNNGSGLEKREYGCRDPLF